MSNDDDYKVGYGKPPLHSQFKKGHSGNPKGRPKGARQINLIKVLTDSLFKKVPVKQGDKVVYLSRYEAGIENINNKFGKGDFQAFRFIMSMDDKIGAQLRENEREVTKGEYSDAKLRLAMLLGIDPGKVGL